MRSLCETIGHGDLYKNEFGEVYCSKCFLKLNDGIEDIVKKRMRFEAACAAMGKLIPVYTKPPESNCNQDDWLEYESQVIKDIAKAAVRQADALIAELEKVKDE